MYVDIWVVMAFAIVVGLCAVWNFNAGLSVGIKHTIDTLVKQKVIEVVAGKAVPYRSKAVEDSK